MAKKQKGTPTNITIHMPGQFCEWDPGNLTSNLGVVPAAHGFTRLPLNGWSVPDITSGGSLDTGVTGFGFMAGCGGRLDNELRFMESELFIPTNVAESLVGPISVYASEDTGPTVTYYPQEWTTVPFCLEAIIISTDSRMLDGWQSFSGPGIPVNNPLFSLFQKLTIPGEQPVTGTYAGATPTNYAGSNTTPLGKILYARMKTYQGGGSTAGFQQLGQETWGGASVLAAERLYWMRGFFCTGLPNITGASGAETMFIKIPDLNLAISGINTSESDLSFIMGLRQNLGSN